MNNGLAVSVLDLVGMHTGDSPGSAIARSVDLARHVEALGYKRFWLAEHHSVEGLACSATSVLIGHVAGATTTIRVGSGGVMLPNHAPLVVAEQFGTLDAMYPGRIDLGLGRAPGGGSAAMRALRRGLNQTAKDFPALLKELRTYLGPAMPDAWRGGESDSRARQQCTDHAAWVQRFHGATRGDGRFAVCFCGPPRSGVSAVVHATVPRWFSFQPCGPSALSDGRGAGDCGGHRRCRAATVYHATAAVAALDP